MIVLEFEEDFKIRRIKFKDLAEKDEWFKANNWILDKSYSLEVKE